MNPFVCPDKIVIYRYPQDMRAGIWRLSEIVAAEMELDAMDGSIYVFVSRDCKKIKMIKFEVSGWVQYYVKAVEGCFKWRHSEEGSLVLTAERRQLLWLLEGLPMSQPQAPGPVTAHGIL